MRRILLLVALTVAMAAQGQRSFTVANADGVALKYEVAAVEPPAVRVAANNYGGNVVVPATVTWNDTAWAVTAIAGNAFRDRVGLRYLHLPASVTALPLNALKGTSRLDSLRFDSPAVVANIDGDPKSTFGSSYNYSRVSCVRVPCGSLASYRLAGWNIFRNLTSDCAVMLTALTVADSVVSLDSVVADGKVFYVGGWYEVGDTATLRYAWFPAADGYMWGFSTGSDQVVVTGPDTVYCLTSRVHYATLGGTNNITTPVSAIGTMSYRNGLANYFIAPFDHKSTIFASAMWISGSVGQGDNTHVSAHRFWGMGTDFVPGPLRTDNGSQPDLSNSFEVFEKYNHVWHITREMIDYHIAHCGEAGYEPAADILTWPGNGDAAEGYASQLAPYYDADGDGRYVALAGDYPLIRGDEATFSIYNDYIRHNASQGTPMYVEIHCMTYAFNEPQDEALHNTLFQHYDIYNRSANDYTDCYLGAWTDFDIGFAGDDYIGCDVRNGMYYGYNAGEIDASGAGSFGSTPPAQSCAILGGPLLPADGSDNPAITDVPGAFAPDNTYGNMGINGTGFGDGIADNERMGMTNFVYYNNVTSGLNSEPTQTSDYFNYMRATWKNGTHVKYGYDGIQGTLNANFMFPYNSDPWHWGTGGEVPDVYPDGWSEFMMQNSPSDRRGVGSTGPFDMPVGSSHQLDLAYTTALGPSGVLSSVAALSAATASVRRQFSADTTDSGKSFVYRPYSAPHEVGIGTAEGGVALNVYPNPTTGMLSVTLSQTEATVVQLYDMMGRRVAEAEAVAGCAGLDMRHLPQGVYILRVGASARRVVKR